MAIFMNTFYNMRISMCEHLIKCLHDNNNSSDDKSLQYLFMSLFLFGVNTKMCKGFMTFSVSSKVSPKDFLQHCQYREGMRKCFTNNCITHLYGSTPVFLQS